MYLAHCAGHTLVIYSCVNIIKMYYYIQKKFPITFTHLTRHHARQKASDSSFTCHRTPSFRSVVYAPQITNQIPPFSRSNAACSNAAKIDPIQWWMRRPPRTSRISGRPILTLHTHLITLPCHISLTHISDPRFDPRFAWLDLRIGIFYFH